MPARLRLRFGESVGAVLLGPGRDFRGAEPARRIDYVLAGWPKRGGLGHVVSAELAGTRPIDGVVPSDHYGVVAELRY